jgi:hypothetical protein
MAGRFLGTALGGALRAELSEAEVTEMWEATDPDLREGDPDTACTLWVWSADYAFRFAPIYFRRINEQAA